MANFNIDIKNEQYVEQSPNNRKQLDTYIILKVQNINKLASLARDYEKWSFELNCLREHLCQHIYRKTPAIVETVPTDIITSVEYLTGVIYTLIQDIIQKTTTGSNIIITLVSDQLLEDNMMKAFLPFTQINKVMKYEKAIDNLFSEITHAIIQKQFNSFILFPLDNNQKKQTKFQEILRIAKS